MPRCGRGATSSNWRRTLPLTVFRYDPAGAGAAPRSRSSAAARRSCSACRAEAHRERPGAAVAAGRQRRRAADRSRRSSACRADPATRRALDPGRQHAARRARRQHRLQRLLARRDRRGARPRLRFAALFEHAPNGYLFFDPQRGITHCNPAALKLFGAADAQRLLGRVPWFPGLSPTSRPTAGPAATRALELTAQPHHARRARCSFEWRFRAPGRHRASTPTST